jgi:hypothetical protein
MRHQFKKTKSLFQKSLWPAAKGVILSTAAADRRSTENRRLTAARVDF